MSLLDELLAFKANFDNKICLNNNFKKINTATSILCTVYHDINRNKCEQTSLAVGKSKIQIRCNIKASQTSHNLFFTELCIRLIAIKQMKLLIDSDWFHAPVFADLRRLLH